MSIENSNDVFFDQLKDVRSATEQTVDTLPDLIQWASDGRLRELLVSYAAETRGHAREILAIFEGHTKEPGDDSCMAMAGLIEGGNAHIELAGDATVRDHLLIAHCNRIGHYLRGAAEFTLAIAKKCELLPEADVVAGMLTSHQDFTRSLAEVGAAAYELELGGGA
jgi:ferritin-like metal-binding protein YciE